ncbi:MAG: histidine phosphatase family protein [Anaerolineales bacterium]|nr:histidine phosphatase family protein [Anaerolineales bacterium]
MTLTLTTPIIYLARHATPDWSRTDLPYHLLPGPPLVPQGEAEAAELGRFLREAGVSRLYTSPLERARRTAEIAAAVAERPVQVEAALAEWRPEENADHIRARFWPVWEQVLAQSLPAGPIMLVTHGGPIGFFLAALGLPRDTLAYYKRTFDRTNPVPPAGVWKAARPAAGEPWDLSLAFVPAAYRHKLVV